MTFGTTLVYKERDRGRERERKQVQQIFLLKAGKEEGDSISHHRSEVQN